MTEETHVEPLETPAANTKEYNYRALESKYEKMLAEERRNREALQAKIEAIEQAKNTVEEDEDDDVYVDKKKLKRSLDKFNEQTRNYTQKEIKQTIQQALQEERQQAWLRQNADFYEVMKHADKIPEVNNDLAETILQMPEGFERQKLVYSTIKSLRLHEPKAKEPSIQEKIDANRRSPYYQPSNVANSPYQSMGDFSAEGKKEAYEKLKNLQKNIRLK